MGQACSPDERKYIGRMADRPRDSLVTELKSSPERGRRCEGDGAWKGQEAHRRPCVCWSRIYELGHRVGWEGTGLLGVGDSMVQAALASRALGGAARQASGIQVEYGPQLGH